MSKLFEAYLSKCRNDLQTGIISSVIIVVITGLLTIHMSVKTNNFDSILASHFIAMFLVFVMLPVLTAKKNENMSNYLVQHISDIYIVKLFISSFSCIKFYFCAHCRKNNKVNTFEDTLP